MDILREGLFLTSATAAVLTVALGLNFLLRNSAAAMRNRILTLAFLVVLMLPLMAQLMPAPDLPPADPIARQAAAHELAAAANHLDASNAGPERRSIAASKRSMPPNAAAEAKADEPMSPGWTSPGQPAGSQTQASSLTKAWIWMALVGAWLLGAIAGLSRLIRAHLRVRRLVRASVPLRNRGLNCLADRLHQEVNLRSPISLLCSSGTETPLTAGLFRHRIILPANAEHWTGEAAEAVLRHEIAHIARADNAVNLLASIVLVLHWFDPLVWFAQHRLRREAEIACDDAVLNGGVRPSAYARILLSLAPRKTGAGLPRCEPLTPFACQAKLRLQTLLNPQVNRRSPGRLATAVLSTLLLSAALPLTPLRPPVPIDHGTLMGSDPSVSLHQATPAVSFLAMLPPGLQAQLVATLDEIGSEFSEARALNAWQDDPTRGTALPDGLTEIPERGLTVEVRDAVALPGSKYGCIFTSENGFVRVFQRQGDATIRYELRAVPHPPASQAQLMLDDMAGLFGAGCNGNFRAYSLSCRKDGDRLPFDGSTRRQLQVLITDLTRHIQHTARPDDDREDRS